jgi:hypothetical protein
MLHLRRVDGTFLGKGRTVDEEYDIDRLGIWVMIERRIDRSFFNWDFL